MKTKILLPILLFLAVLQFGFAQTAVPKLITYQGVLTQQDGKTPADGFYDITFGVHLNPTIANSEWEDTFYNVKVDSGLFSVDIGSQKPLDLPFDVPYWLSIKVKEQTGSFIFDDRIRFTSAPYAFRADTANVAKSVVGGGVPVGVVVAWTGVYDAIKGYTLPEGWLGCNGVVVNSSQYPQLYEIIGTTYGTGDGSAGSFNLPDYRGRFLRGADAGTGRDPDVEGRTGSGTPFSGGPFKIGSIQEDAFQGHVHNSVVSSLMVAAGGSYSLRSYSGTSSGPTEDTSEPGSGLPKSPIIQNGKSEWGTYDNPRYGKETRPKNIYVTFIIKAK